MRATVVGLVGLTCGALLSGCGAAGLVSGEGTTTLNPTPSASRSLPARSAAVTAEIELDMPGNSIAVSDAAVWVRTGGRVVRIDPDTSTVVATIPVGSGQFGNVAAVDDGVWVTSFLKNAVYRIDPATNEVVAEIPVGTNPEGIAVTADAVWVSNHRAGSVSHVDPATDGVVETIAVGPNGPSGPKAIVFAGGALWTAVPNISAVVRVDLETLQVDKVFLARLHNVFSNGDDIFAIAGDGITVIDATTITVVREVKADIVPSGYGNGWFWAVAGTDLWRLDRDTLAPLQSWRIADEDSFGHVAIDDHSAWVLLGSERLGEERVVLRVDVN